MHTYEDKVDIHLNKENKSLCVQLVPLPSTQTIYVYAYEYTLEQTIHMQRRKYLYAWYKIINTYLLNELTLDSEFQLLFIAIYA